MELNDGNLVALGAAGLIALGGMVANYIRDVIRGDEHVPSMAGVMMIIPIVLGVVLVGMSMIWRLEHFMSYGLLTASAGPPLGIAALAIRQGPRKVIHSAKGVPVLIYCAGGFFWSTFVLYGIGDATDSVALQAAAFVSLFASFVFAYIAPRTERVKAYLREASWSAYGQ